MIDYINLKVKKVVMNSIFIIITTVSFICCWCSCKAICHFILILLMYGSFELQQISLNFSWLQYGLSSISTKHFRRYCMSLYYIVLVYLLVYYATFVNWNMWRSSNIHHIFIFIHVINNFWTVFFFLCRSLRQILHLREKCLQWSCLMWCLH